MAVWVDANGQPLAVGDHVRTIGAPLGQPCFEVRELDATDGTVHVTLTMDGKQGYGMFSPWALVKCGELPPASQPATLAELQEVQDSIMRATATLDKADAAFSAENNTGVSPHRIGATLVFLTTGELVRVVDTFSSTSDPMYPDGYYVTTLYGRLHAAFAWELEAE